ncbi:uncharacterized protein PFB0315w isoform X2 [Acyrthosiphon pisum]|nr:uncharacterized protein PFB0315w isoform X2 [Acyrthosiphon pisum]|eukprot:XP_008188897.1 PREDICTED: uncharacterized protein PFB0315w isoform X2 [Acyrthosiphon pisum]
MAEVNEISNQANLDYIFDSYYSSVSRYNTGFELPEDCKNMSFSELFDQELFSTHENKDCQITIKIEKEEPLNECYSADNSVDTADNLSFVKIEENIPPSKSFAPKRGINRTSIKTTGTSDVKHLIHNPFCETEQVNNQMLEYINSSIVKCEAEDVNDNVEENLVEMGVNPYDSADDLQNNTGLEKSEEHIVSSSLLKSSTPKRRGINRISIKTPDNSDAKHLLNPFCEPKDLANYQIPVKVQTPIIKCAPIDENETIEETIVGLHYSPDDSKTTSNSHSLVKVKNSVSKHGSLSTNRSHNIVIDSVTPLVLKKSTSKYQDINKISLKTTNNVKHPSKPKHLGTNQTSIKVQTPIVKIEPENVDNSIEKPIVEKEVKPCYSADNLNCTSNNHNFVKEEIRLSSLLKNSAAKRRANNKKSIKATENESVKNIAHSFHFEPKKIINNQISVKLATTVIKREPEDFNDTSKENIEMETNPSYSSNGIKSTVEGHSLVKIDKIVSSPKGFASQHRGTDGNSIKTTDNSKNHLIYNLNYKPKDLGNNLTSVKYKIPIIKREPENDNNTIQPNALINLKSKKETKFVDQNEINSSDLINKNAESQEVIIKNMVTIASSIKTEDIDSQTDKKKISWEEFRAKREKMGLISISEIKEEPIIDIIATDNVKMKAMKEEFDRNTAEHFTGQKRKIDDKEEQNTTAKVIDNEEEELQKKRMKIEYIKKLLPSSFASEIAKTSSLMKGSSLVEDNDNESASDDSMLSNDKTQGKYSNTHDKSQKKGHQTRVHSSHRNSSRSDYNNKSSRSSSTSSNPDDYYNRNRTDAPSQGSQYNQNARTTLQRPKEQKRVVYVGQIPIKLGKRYLHNRFKEFGTIQSLTLHKKPDFRVYYAFVTYSENSEADRAIAHGNDDETEVQLDIRFGERKQTQTPYYDLDDEWLTDWYGYKQPLAPVVKAQTPEKVSFEEELQEFYKLAQIKKLNKIKSSQVS